MVDTSILSKYFALSECQIAQFEQLHLLYSDWNQKINVISRKDIQNLYERHILHSLAIAKFIKFTDNSKVLDLGTGGGFPGIPLAILFPSSSFTLIDGTRKKLTVVQDVAEKLALNNVTVLHKRAEEMKDSFDFVVTRAVASSTKLFRWCQPLFASKHKHALPNGIIALKGGKLKEELRELPKGVYTECVPLSDFFEEAFFLEKQILYIQA